MKESGERFRALASCSTEGIIIVDEQANIIFWNHSVEALTGYSEREMIDQKAYFLRPARYRKIHKNNFNKYLETHKPRFINKLVESIISKKNGEEIPVEISTTVWKQKGKPYYSLFIKDITDRKKKRRARPAETCALQGGKVVVREFDNSTVKFTAYVVRRASRL